MKKDDFEKLIGKTFTFTLKGSEIGQLTLKSTCDYPATGLPNAPEHPFGLDFAGEKSDFPRELLEGSAEGMEPFAVSLSPCGQDGDEYHYHVVFN